MGKKPDVIYKGRVFDLLGRDLRFRGGSMRFVYAASHGSAVILPVSGDGRILLERNYRYAIRKSLYELPAGHLNKGERAAGAAARELREETGYRPSRLTPLFRSYSSPGVSNELYFFFLASGLVKGRASREPDERMTLRFVTLEKAMAMIRGKEIEDTKTIACLMFYSEFVKRVIA